MQRSTSVLLLGLLITHTACISDFDTDSVRLSSAQTSTTSTTSTTTTSTTSTTTTTATCTDDQIECNGQCITPNTVGQCGSCAPCVPPPNSIAEACDEGTCIFQCTEGFVDLNNDLNAEESDGCEYTCPSFPPTTEACDGVDNNCDGVVDEGCDDDGDGFCDQALGYQTDDADPQPLDVCPHGPGDCNDDPNNNGALSYPGAPVVCGFQTDSCNQSPINPNHPIARLLDPTPKSWLRLSLTPHDYATTNPSPSALLAWYNERPDSRPLPETSLRSPHATPMLASWSEGQHSLSTRPATTEASPISNLDLVALNLSPNSNRPPLRGDLVGLSTRPTTEPTRNSPFLSVSFDMNTLFVEELIDNHPVLPNRLSGMHPRAISIERTALDSSLTSISLTCTQVDEPPNPETPFATCNPDDPDRTEAQEELVHYPRIPLDQDPIRTGFTSGTFSANYVRTDAIHSNTSLSVSSALHTNPNTPPNLLSAWSTVRTDSSSQTSFYEVAWVFLPQLTPPPQSNFSRQVWGDGDGDIIPDTPQDINTIQRAPHTQVTPNILDQDSPDQQAFILTFFQNPNTLRIIWLNPDRNYSKDSPTMTVSVPQGARPHTLRMTPAFANIDSIRQPHGAWLAFVDQDSTLQAMRIPPTPDTPTRLETLPPFQAAPFAPLDLDSSPNHIALGFIGLDESVNLLLLDPAGNAVCSP